MGTGRHLRPAQRRRRLLASGVVVVAVAVVAVTLVVVVGGRGHRSAATQAAARPAKSSTTTTTVPELSKVTPDGTFAVGTTNLAITYPASAPGDSGLPLPTEVWYPAVASGPGTAPERRPGPYPLLVFSQGFGLPVSDYQGLLTQWASAGFVVAAPTYPYTSGPFATPAAAETAEADITNHPADLRFVITTMLQVSGEQTSLLHGLINPQEIGITGHSDGGDVSLTVADNTCCKDTRVKALAVLSGAELWTFGGTYFSGSQVPILVVQGDADTINYPGCSEQIYNEASDPKYYLDLLGAEHEPPYIQPGPYETVVANVTTDYFEAELRGVTTALGTMMSAGNVPGTASIISGGTAPAYTTGCPGAP